MNRTKLRKRIRRAALLLGLLIYLSPELSTCALRIKTAYEKRNFVKSSTELSIGEENEAAACGEGSCAETADAELAAGQISSEDREVTEEGTAEEAWTEEKLWEIYADSMIGYIEIPKMNLTLSLYLGCSEKHLADGAAVLEESDLPLGGAGRNCVIAAHRGYAGAPYFREIELLEEGDLVYITNPGKTLTYQVMGTAVIEPTDVEALAASPDKDMVTLLTCHPYRSHGKYRYLVFCERVREDGTAEIDQEISVQKTENAEQRNEEVWNTEAQLAESILSTDGADDNRLTAADSQIPFSSSAPQIGLEKALRAGGLLFLLLLLVKEWKIERKQ